MDAIEAYNILLTEKVDLILLDIKMPRVDGSEMYDIIKLFHSGSKVIVSSVYPLDEQKRIIAEAEDYYDKSQGTSILLSKINKALGSGSLEN